MAGASGKKLDETVQARVAAGLKTTYYLRTLAATQAEKSTGEGGELNAVPSSGGLGSAVASGGAIPRRRVEGGGARDQVLQDRRPDVRKPCE
jgi:ribonucleoside-diphosphate reductase alpha chain